MLDLPVRMLARELGVELAPCSCYGSCVAVFTKEDLHAYVKAAVQKSLFQLPARVVLRQVLVCQRSESRLLANSVEIELLR